MESCAISHTESALTCGIHISAMMASALHRKTRELAVQQVILLQKRNFVVSNVYSFFLGRFAYLNFLQPSSAVFLLNTTSKGVIGKNTQCLIYYYYLPDDTAFDHSIVVIKEERDKQRTVIDTVSSSPWNGWIRRAVNYDTVQPGYQVVR